MEYNPTSMKVKKKKRKCPICDRVFIDKAHLVDHIGRVHAEQIPEGWSAGRYECYLRTGKTEGKCIYCNKPTEFNETTGKYHRLCTNPECRKKCSDNADKNMIGKYGKTHLLNDPDMQRKMVYSKKNSGTYVFKDNDSNRKYEVMYDSSYGLDFLTMLDIFLNMSGRDIIGPSPHTYYYEYDGETHFYIPDFYIVSLGLEIEIKDGGDNPNKHPKIQAIDKKKEELKDQVMLSNSNQVRYLKIVNKNYSEFFALLSKLKEEDVVYVPKWDYVDPNNIKVQPTSEGYYDVIDSLPIDNALNEPSMELPNLLKQTAYIHDPGVSYDELIDSLSKEVKSIRRPDEYIRVESKINLTRNYLVKLQNSMEFGDENLRYAAKNAVKKIERKLLPQLKSKKVHLDRLAITKKTIEESCCVSSDNCIMEFTSDGTVSENYFRIPVYVILTQTGTTASKVISKFTGDPYNHSGLSIDPTMHNMFSFNMNAGGFGIEDIDKGFFGDHKSTIKYTIWAYFASPDEFLHLKSIIGDFTDNKDKFKYNIMGLVDFITGNKKLREGKMFCSEFVAHLLKSINPNITKKNRNDMKPYDLVRIKDLHFIQRGILKNYDPKKTERIVKEKIEEGGYVLWN